MSGVRFAAMIPAIRAAARTSPFGSVPSATRRRTCSGITTCARATARRFVTGFPPTSIMRISLMRAEVYGAEAGTVPKHRGQSPGPAHNGARHLYAGQQRLQGAGVGPGRAAVGVAARVAAAHAHADHSAGRRQRLHLGHEPLRAPPARGGEVDARRVGRIEHVAVQVHMDRRIRRQRGQRPGDVVGDDQPRARRSRSRSPGSRSRAPTSAARASGSAADRARPPPAAARGTSRAGSRTASRPGSRSGSSPACSGRRGRRATPARGRDARRAARPSPRE